MTSIEDNKEGPGGGEVAIAVQTIPHDEATDFFSILITRTEEIRANVKKVMKSRKGRPGGYVQEIEANGPNNTERDFESDNNFSSDLGFFRKRDI
ncbi:hypothetical protein NPIL_410771 [Nephila pilipes]|uniref:Uncharacterized protein n=1 Tax=Nephila pilipes TaxID=299642 RepID=A0A8X6TMG0_NEPPI|nr:hypothetical protein NPIL_410771 [Nephila pilipes]